MWKYWHSVKENPKSGYDWSATGQWQTAFCVCQLSTRNFKNVEDLVLSQEDNPKTHLLNREICMWNWHSLTDSTQNNLSRSLAQLCQTTLRTAVIWNQSRCPSDSRANSCCKRYSLSSYGLGMKSVYRRTTIQLAERSGLCTSRYQEATQPTC